MKLRRVPVEVMPGVSPLEYCLSVEADTSEYSLVGVNVLKNLHVADIFKLFKEQIPDDAEVVVRYLSQEGTYRNLMYLGKFRTVRQASGIALIKGKHEYDDPLEKVLCNMSVSEYCSFAGRNPEEYHLVPMHIRTEVPDEDIFNLARGEIPPEAEAVLSDGLPRLSNIQKSEFFGMFTVEKYFAGVALMPKGVKKS